MSFAFALKAYTYLPATPTAAAAQHVTQSPSTIRGIESLHRCVRYDAQDNTLRPQQLQHVLRSMLTAPPVQAALQDLGNLPRSCPASCLLGAEVP